MKKLHLREQLKDYITLHYVEKRHPRIIAYILLTCSFFNFSQLPPRQENRHQDFEAVVQIPKLSDKQKIEFLGWNYGVNGFTLSTGEDVTLMFRNNTGTAAEFQVGWELKTYEGEPVSKGASRLSLAPGATGDISVPLPKGLEDGPYMIQYSPDAEGWKGTYPFYFDLHRPVPDEFLNLNLVAFIENMDTKGWARMLLGPLEGYCNILNVFPGNMATVDAVIVIAEALDFFNPKFAQLRKYVMQGGTILVYGKTAPVLSEMLPVSVSSKIPDKKIPLSLKPLNGGPWQRFQPGEEFLHYTLPVKAKEGAKILAEWSDGSPAVVKGMFGQGKVIYIGTGSYQVWQNNPALKGADEMALRLLYDDKGGKEAVDAMLSHAEKVYNADRQEDIIIRDRVFEGLEMKKPEEFIVISKNNIGRFGWSFKEGGLTENMNEKGRVSALGTSPMGFSISVEGNSEPVHTAVNQNWLVKNIEWTYGNGEKVVSTLSLGTPAIMWEGKSENIAIDGGGFTHVAYPSGDGVIVVGKGEKIDPAEMTENWLLAFTDSDTLRDMPQLIVLTRRPRRTTFDEGLNFTFADGGFGTIFTSRLYGIQRMAPGETREWVHELPEEAAGSASRWSRIFLSFPVDCDEIGWLEKDTVRIADRFRFKDFHTDWNTKSLRKAMIPPVYILAKNVGSPVQLPGGLTDMDCPTKYGPLMGVNGSFTMTDITLPLSDQRALVSHDEGMELGDAINRNVRGMDLNSLFYNDQVYHSWGGKYDKDMLPYDISHRVPYYEAPQIDLYKWWLVFNAILTRPVFSDEVRQEVDRHFTTRYWETLNFYPHKSLTVRKREPFTGTKYMVTFVWPTNTINGYRQFADVNEAAGVNTYCYTNYARYYGDWTTLRANWNLCRELHDYLRKTKDWACRSSGNQEDWGLEGLDMLNSEPFGSLAFGYAAEHTGNPEDGLAARITGTQSLLTAVARLALKPYIRSITADGDPWREFVSFWHFTEMEIMGSNIHRGGVAFLNTSKGAMHELALAYKMWAPQAMNEEQRAMKAAGSSPLCDLTQRLFLGWNNDSLLHQVVNSLNYHKKNPTSFEDAAGIYDMAVLCMGNTPVFLSDWAPAEYISGKYDNDKKEMRLTFLSHLGVPFKVRIYSQYQPVEVMINGKLYADQWKYDQATGWLEVGLRGNERKDLNIRFGKRAAPLHPYFSGIKH